MTVEDDLERRLLAKGTVGSADEYWLLATRRAAMAGAAEAGQARQHLSLAAIFAGRGIKARERDVARLSAYAEWLQAAGRARALPSDLRPVHARLVAELRRGAGQAEPRILAKKTKRLCLGEVGLALMICDATRWGEFFFDGDEEQAIREGRAIFVDGQGSDGWLPVHLRVLEGGEPELGARDLVSFAGQASGPALLDVASGLLRVAGAVRFDAGDDEPLESIRLLELETEPGVYKVRMFRLVKGERESVVIVAVRAADATASNDVPTLRHRDEETPGLLVLPS